jgi:hypothetical protein
MIRVQRKYYAGGTKGPNANLPYFTIVGVLFRSCNPMLRIEIDGWVLGGRVIEDSEFATKHW